MDDFRDIRFDASLGVEAYHFKGVMQPFPNHFHDYYVVGCVEDGLRRMVCHNREYLVGPGDLILFNPGDTHGCDPVDGRALSYRCFNIATDTMCRWQAEHGGPNFPLRLPGPLITGGKLSVLHRSLHRMIMEDEEATARQAHGKAFLQALLALCSMEKGKADPEQEKLEGLCTWLEESHSRSVTLEEMACRTGMNKYTLLRSFVRRKGITPYRYVEVIRISRAGQYLREGMGPAAVALVCGFADQSHFSRFFKRLMGLAPKQYQRIYLPAIGTLIANS